MLVFQHHNYKIQFNAPKYLANLKFVIDLFVFFLNGIWRLAFLQNIINQNEGVDNLGVLITLDRICWNVFTLIKCSGDLAKTVNAVLHGWAIVCRLLNRIHYPCLNSVKVYAFEWYIIYQG